MFYHNTESICADICKEPEFSWSRYSSFEIREGKNVGTRRFVQHFSDNALMMRSELELDSFLKQGVERLCSSGHLGELPSVMRQSSKQRSQQTDILGHGHFIHGFDVTRVRAHAF